MSHSRACGAWRAPNALGREAQVSEADRFAANILPVICAVQGAGAISLVAITDALNARGIRSARGGRWMSPPFRTCLREREPADPGFDTREKRAQAVQAAFRAAARAAVGQRRTAPVPALAAWAAAARSGS